MWRGRSGFQLVRCWLTTLSLSSCVGTMFHKQHKMRTIIGNVCLWNNPQYCVFQCSRNSTSFTATVPIQEDVKSITAQSNSCIDTVITLQFGNSLFKQPVSHYSNKKSALKFITNYPLFQRQSPKLFSEGWTVTAGDELFWNVYVQWRNFFVLGILLFSPALIVYPVHSIGSR